MKNELERIWNEQPLAFPLHLARWEVTEIKSALWFWFGKVYKIVTSRGKRLNPIRKIHKIWK